MARYDYKCPECGHTREVTHLMSECDTHVEQCNRQLKPMFVKDLEAGNIRDKYCQGVMRRQASDSFRFRMGVT